MNRKKIVSPGGRPVLRKPRAVSFYFARKLFEELKMPIGIVLQLEETSDDSIVGED